MPAIPAQCTNPRCRAIYPSGIYIENSRDVRLSGNRSQCPVCGSMGVVAEGVFNITNDTIEVISASRTSVEMLSEFRTILEALRTGAITKEEATAAAEAIDPKLGGIVRESGDNLALLALLLTILTFAFDIWKDHGDDAFQHALLAKQDQIIGLLSDQRGNELRQEAEPERAAPAKRKPFHQDDCRRTKLRGQR